MPECITSNQSVCKNKENRSQLRPPSNARPLTLKEIQIQWNSDGYRRKHTARIAGATANRDFTGAKTGVGRGGAGFDITVTLQIFNCRRYLGGLIGRLSSRALGATYVQY
jgi:hypothetical protein